MSEVSNLLVLHVVIIYNLKSTVCWSNNSNTQILKNT